MANMTKEDELMNFLHEKVFDPILNSPTAPAKVKSGVNLTIGRMRRLTARKMIEYYWSALSTSNAIEFSKKIKDAKLPRFEDCMEEFRERFNEDWLKR